MHHYLIDVAFSFHAVSNSARQQNPIYWMVKHREFSSVVNVRGSRIKVVFFWVNYDIFLNQEGGSLSQQNKSGLLVLLVFSLYHGHIM